MTLRHVDLSAFTIGQAVRYTPGTGTYGYEDALRQSADGRLSAVVIGFSRTRIRVRIQADLGRVVIRAVDPKSLTAVLPRGTSQTSERSQT